jgi:peptidylprolyl isomerase
MTRKGIFSMMLVSVLLSTWSCASPDNPTPASNPAPAADPAPAEPVATAPDPAAAPAAEGKSATNVEPAPATAAKMDTSKETTLSSGLKIVELVVGKGEEAKVGDQAQVHYTGWLYENGKRGAKFDSSLDRGTPFPIAVGVDRVIRGWNEGIPGMRVGGKRQLIIPPDLGYGANGAGGVIPPNATLDFEIELLSLAK